MTKEPFHRISLTVPGVLVGARSRTYGTVHRVHVPRILPARGREFPHPAWNSERVSSLEIEGPITGLVNSLLSMVAAVYCTSMIVHYMIMYHLLIV